MVMVNRIITQREEEELTKYVRNRLARTRSGHAIGSHKDLESGGSNRNLLRPTPSRSQSGSFRRTGSQRPKRPSIRIERLPSEANCKNKVGDEDQLHVLLGPSRSVGNSRRTSEASSYSHSPLGNAQSHPLVLTREVPPVGVNHNSSSLAGVHSNEGWIRKASFDSRTKYQRASSGGGQFAKAKNKAESETDVRLLAAKSEQKKAGLLQVNESRLLPASILRPPGKATAVTAASASEIDSAALGTSSTAAEAAVSASTGCVKTFVKL